MHVSYATANYSLKALQCSRRSWQHVQPMTKTDRHTYRETDVRVDRQDIAKTCQNVSTDGCNETQVTAQLNSTSLRPRLTNISEAFRSVAPLPSPLPKWSSFNSLPARANVGIYHNGGGGRTRSIQM